MVAGSAHQQVGYLLRSYPRYSQTFILNEILALEELGVPVQIFALTDPHEAIVQAQAAGVRARAHYLDIALRPGLGRHLSGQLRALLPSPRRYLQTLLFVLKGQSLDAGYRSASRLECFRMAVYLVRLIRELQRKGEEIVHLHAHFAHDPALIALLVHRLTGISYSFTAHARDLYQLAVPALQERARAADALVTCCAANRDYLEGVLPEPLRGRVRLIHHGVDLRVFSPPAESEEDPERPVILSVGRLIEKKGFPVLLDAYRQLRDAGVAFSACIYGEGPLHGELAALIDRFHLHGWVTLGGALNQEQLVPHYRRAALFALTPYIPLDGDRDGIPNVLVEAMACGLPVVSTAVAGIPELVTHGRNGLLFSPGDAAAVAGGLAGLLKDHDRRKRLGQVARQTVVDHFDLRAGACQMAGLFRQFQVGWEGFANE